MKIYNNVVYNKDNLLLDLYTPDNEGFTTIVYFHGGGISSGDKACLDTIKIACQFVKAGYAFASVNYRLYPNAKFPEYVIDCADAVSFIKENITRYGGSNTIIVSGQSAGAWLAAMLMLDKHYLLDKGVDPLSISGWIIESGQMTTHFNIIDIEDKMNPFIQRIDQRAPIYFVDENTKFSKALFFYYDNDMPMRKEQNILLYKTIKYFNDKADIEIKELNGAHCAGSCLPEKDGSYRYVAESLIWLRNKNI